MTNQPEGFFLARVGKFGSVKDPQPFDLNADLGPMPSQVVVSSYGHSTLVDGRLPVGHGSIERIGNDLVARGEVWLETAAGRDTWAMLNRLGSRTRFSVGYRTLASRGPTPDEAQRGVKSVLTAVRLVEVSAVVEPAEPDTALLELKGSRAEVEATLRQWRELAALHEKAIRLRTRAVNLEAETLFERFRQLQRGRAA